MTVQGSGPLRGLRVSQIKKGEIMRSKFYISTKKDTNKVESKQKKIRKVLQEVERDLYQVSSGLKNARKNGGVDREDTIERIDHYSKQEAFLIALKRYLNELDQITISKRKLYKKLKAMRHFLNNYRFKKANHSKMMTLSDRAYNLIKDD